YRYIGSGTPAGNTITVNGHGTVERAPDTARLSFTVRNTAVTVAEAQEAVSAKITQIKYDLEMAGVASDDITTQSYNSYPQYTYVENNAPVRRAYIVSLSVTVKIKNPEIVKTVVGILGTNNATDMQGPNFGFDDDTEVAR